MPEAIRLYIAWVTRINRVLGRVVMWGAFAMMALLVYSAVSRNIFNMPLFWAVEMSQFMLAAYYILGGPYSMQLGDHVRMDLIYTRWSIRGRAFADSLTAFALIFYLVFLLLGGLSSTLYALQYGQKNYSAWAPPLAPIKIIMCLGIMLMLLQAFAYLFRDWYRWRGVEIGEELA